MAGIREWNASDGRFIRATGERGESIRGPRDPRMDARCCGLDDDSRDEGPFHGKKLDLPFPKIASGLFGSRSDDRRWLFFSGRHWPARVWVEGLQDTGIGYQLVLWDTSTGKSRVLSDEETGHVLLTISPDGRKVARRAPGTRLGHGHRQTPLEVPNYNAEQMHFTPDARVLIAPGGAVNAVAIWDADTGEPAKELIPRAILCVDVRGLPDGSLLLMPTETDYLLWNMKKRSAIAGQGPPVWTGTFAPDGRSVVAHDTIFRKWDVAAGKNLYEDVASLGMSPVKKLFYSPMATRFR